MQNQINLAEEIFCHDCRRALKDGENVMPYEVRGENFYKCEACHQKDPVLRNFQKCEVYSRIVGYIRPVSQWNVGKKAEFGDRQEYALQDNCC